jgi:hypothetical protein
MCQRQLQMRPFGRAAGGRRLRDLEAADYRDFLGWEPSAGTAGCPVGPALRATPGPTSYAQETPS